MVNDNEMTPEDVEKALDDIVNGTEASLKNEEDLKEYM